MSCHRRGRACPPYHTYFSVYGINRSRPLCRSFCPPLGQKMKGRYIRTYQVFLMNCSPQLGHLILILPFPLGTLSSFPHCGHLKKAWVFSSSFRLAFLSSSAFFFASFSLFFCSFSASLSLLKKLTNAMFSDLLFPTFFDSDLKMPKNADTPPRSMNMPWIILSSNMGAARKSTTPSITKVTDNSSAPFLPLKNGLL